MEQEKPLAVEIADGRIGINHRLIPTLDQEECIEVDRWATEDRIHLAETMIRRWQKFIENENAKF